MMDGGEQGGVAADQRRVFQRQQPAVRLAVLPDPLVGQFHGPGPVDGSRPDRFLGLFAEKARFPAIRLSYRDAFRTRDAGSFGTNDAGSHSVVG